jgi:hypothetical protein
MVKVNINGQPVEVMEGDRIISSFNSDSLSLHIQILRQNPAHPELWDIVAYEKQEWF